MPRPVMRDDGDIPDPSTPTKSCGAIPTSVARNFFRSSAPFA